MRVALVFAILAVSIALGAALTCFTDSSKCAEDECCVSGIGVSRCKKLKEIDEKCEIRPSKHLIPKHVYRAMCPCREGLECKGGDNIVGKFFGTCQMDSSEVPETPDE